MLGINNDEFMNEKGEFDATKFALMHGDGVTPPATAEESDTEARRARPKK